MKTNHTIIMGSLGLLSFTILSGVFLSSNTTSADTEVIDQVRLTVPIACTMTGENTSHTATLDPGTYSGATGSEYENGIGKTTMTAICNDDNGFSIYAIGYTGNEYGATNLIGNNTNGAIATKAYQSGDTTSNWSMKLTKVTDTSQSYNPTNLTITTSYDTWHAVPDTYTKVAQYKANTGSSTTDTTLGVKLETTYAAFIAANQPADTYTGQVKYTMVHPYNEEPLQPQTANSGCINYFPNGSNVVGTMGCQETTTSDTIVTLLASNFSRTGYGFAGWSNKYDYATNPNQEGIKFYGPQEDITFTAGQYTGDNDGLALYAVWIKSQGNLQDSSKVATTCNGLTQAPIDGTANLNSVSALTDQRDNETYSIAKLADGNCWMIENLRLESTAAHNSDGSLAQGYGTSTIYGNFSGLADAENTNFTVSNNSGTAPTEANSLYYAGTQSGTASIDISQTSYAGYRIPRYNNYNHKPNSANRPQDPTTNSATNSATNASMYSYGNYYTWHAAIADTTYYSSGDHNTTSLCPTGWRLPMANNPPQSFRILDIALGGTGSGQWTPTGDSLQSKKWRSFPNNFLYSGGFSTSSAYNRGSGGYYWSSSVNYDNFSYEMNLSRSSMYPTSGGYKYIGHSIRCIVSPSA